VSDLKITGFGFFFAVFFILMPVTLLFFAQLKLEAGALKGRSLTEGRKPHGTWPTCVLVLDGEVHHCTLYSMQQN
jgi:hypothetical protein